MFSVSTDKAAIDPQIVTAWLSDTYWAKGISIDEVKWLMEVSTCFGGFEDDKLIAYARLTQRGQTPYAQIADVYVSAGLRHKGYGSLLMKRLLEVADSAGILTLDLRTDDASTFYKKFGFDFIANRSKDMRRVREPPPSAV